MGNTEKKIEKVIVTIDNQDQIEFKLHTFYEVLEAFIEPKF